MLKDDINETDDNDGKDFKKAKKRKLNTHVRFR